MPSQTDVHPEILVIRGHLDRLGAFAPLRCYSTRFVSRYPQPASDDYVLHLVDAEGKELTRNVAAVVPAVHCGPGAATRWALTGCLGLVEQAASVILTARERAIWQATIPKAPSLSVRLAGRTISRERPVELQLALSPPGQDAYVGIVYQWGERGYQVLKFAPARPRLTVDLAGLPGGHACRFVLHYCNGLRSTTAVSRSFRLPLLGPTLSIVEPAVALTLGPGEPLELAGQVIDPERRQPGNTLQEELSWWIGEECIGRGPVAVIMQPTPGKHRVVLRYAHSDNARATVDVTVRPRETGDPLPADAWTESNARWG